MRILNLLLLVIFFTQCSSRQNFYHGYVYDEQTNISLKNVLVEVNYPLKSIHTNSYGYFKIKNNTNSESDLIFSLNGFEKDTAVTTWVCCVGSPKTSTVYKYTIFINFKL